MIKKRASVSVMQATPEKGVTRSVQWAHMVRTVREYVTVRTEPVVITSTAAVCVSRGSKVLAVTTACVLKGSLACTVNTAASATH